MSGPSLRSALAWLLLPALVLAAAWWLLPGQGQEKVPAAPTVPLTYRGVELQARTIETSAGERFEFAHAKLEVPEVRAKPNSRALSIGFAVIPKRPDAGDVPVFLVAGGPGSSYIKRIEEPWLQDMIALLRRVGDVVLVDLRGIHSSTPNFRLGGVERKFRVIGDRERFDTLLHDAGAAGREKLLRDGFDLDGYVVTEAAADIIAVADTLGYEKIHMQGTSFGSHLTFTTVREYPHRVDRFLVSGLEGYDHTFDDGREVLKALQLIAGETHEVWAGAHDASDPLAALQALAARAAEDPKDAFGLREHEVLSVFTSGELFGFDYRLSNRQHMAGWPAAVDQLLKGKRTWRAWWVRRLAGFAVGRFPAEAAVGLFDCSSAISRSRRLELEASAPPHFPDDLRQMDALCRGWSVAPLPADFQAGTRSDVPGLFVHGTYDVSTPYANATQMLAQFPNASLVTVVGGSHAALTEAIGNDAAFGPALVAWFNGGAAPGEVRLAPLRFDPLSP
ncbi:MAG: alpha/beta hydrolase [Pseudomonadota bacterium]